MADKLNIVSIFLSSRKKLSAVVAKIVPGHDVEDILQETYLRAHQAQLDHRIKEPSAFVMQIAKNLALDHIKSAAFRKLNFADKDVIEGLANQDLHVDPTVSAITSQQDLQQFLVVVQTLPQKCQEVYVLKKIYGYTQSEIADRLSITVSAVEKHIAYGTKKLFHYMQGRAGEISQAKTNRVTTLDPKGKK